MQVRSPPRLVMVVRYIRQAYTVPKRSPNRCRRLIASSSSNAALTLVRSRSLLPPAMLIHGTAHVYVWPRFTTYEGHAHKSFVPFTDFLKRAQSLDDTCPSPDQHIERASSVVVHAQVVGLTDTHVLLDHDMCHIDGLTEDLYEDVDGGVKPELEVDMGKQCCGAGGCLPARRCRGRAVPYDYLIYALGCRLPKPLFSEARTKCDGASARPSSAARR